MGESEPEVEGFKKFLVNVGKWKPENIYALEYPTFDEFKKAVDDIAKKVKDEDIVLIGINAHTTEDFIEFGKYCTWVRCDDEKFEKIYYDELVKELEKIEKGKIIVEIEGCYSGGAINYFKNSEIKNRVVVITSTDAEHKSGISIISHIFDCIKDQNYLNADYKEKKYFISLKDAFDYSIEELNYTVEKCEENVCKIMNRLEISGYPQLYDPNNVSEKIYLRGY